MRRWLGLLLRGRGGLFWGLAGRCCSFGKIESGECRYEGCKGGMFVARGGGRRGMVRGAWDVVCKGYGGYLLLEGILYLLERVCWVRRGGESNLLVVFEEVVGAAVGTGMCDRISVRSAERDFWRADIKVSISKETFFRRLENDMKMILLLDICTLRQYEGLRHVTDVICKTKSRQIVDSGQDHHISI